MADAACLEHPEVEFIPANPSTEQNADEAPGHLLAVPSVGMSAWAYAVADPTLLGIWAGTIATGRRALRRRRAA